MTTADSNELTTTSPPDSARLSVQQFVKSLLRELLAYGRESLIYPTDHPHLVERTRSTRETIVHFAKQRGAPLFLQVRGGTIYSGNEPVDPGGEAGRKLATFLRERMVQLVCILPDVTIEEAGGLADFLVGSDHRSLGNSRRLELGENVHLYRFPRKFSEAEDPVSEEDIVAQGQQDDADSDDFGLDESEWFRFDEDQMRIVRKILRNDELRNRIEEVLKRQQGNADAVKVDFIPGLFELLRCSPRANWESANDLVHTIEASLKLLEEAQSVRETGGAFPLHLLDSPRGCPDPLGNNLRWQLVNRFLPDQLSLQAPREEVDLAVLAGKRTAPGGSPSVSAGWQRPDTVLLSDEFSDFFEGRRFLCEYTAVLTHLVLRNEDSENQLAERYFQILEMAFYGKAAGVPMVRSLVYIAGQLPRAIYLRWSVRILRTLARPDDVLTALGGLNRVTTERLLKSPPSPLNSPVPENGEVVNRYREMLRRILCMGDDYAADVVFGLLSGPKRKLARGYGWGRLFRELAALHRGLDSWVAGRVKQCCSAEALTTLAMLPFRNLKNGIRAAFEDASEGEQKKFITTLEELDSPEGSRLLTTAFRFPSSLAREAAFRTLGRHTNSTAFDILAERLEKHNKSSGDERELRLICSALASQKEKGQSFLTRVCRQKKGMFGFEWKKSIRSAAEEALRR